MTIQQTAVARTYGLALVDAKRPELGWRLIETTTNAGVVR